MLCDLSFSLKTTLEIPYIYLFSVGSEADEVHLQSFHPSEDKDTNNCSMEKIRLSENLDIHEAREIKDRAFCILLTNSSLLALSKRNP